MYKTIWRERNGVQQFSRVWVPEPWELVPPVEARLDPKDIPWSAFEEQQYGAGYDWPDDPSHGSINSKDVPDVVRHATTDVNARALDLSDVEAAYEYETGHSLSLRLSRHSLHTDAATASDYDEMRYRTQPDFWDYEGQWLEDVRTNVEWIVYSKILERHGMRQGDDKQRRRDVFPDDEYGWLWLSNDDPRELK